MQPKILPEYAATALLIWRDGLDRPPTVYLNGGSVEADRAIQQMLEKLTPAHDTQN